MPATLHGAGHAIAAAIILDALPHPVFTLAADDRIASANDAAERFFKMSRSGLARTTIHELVPFGSPVLALLMQVRERKAAVAEYRIDLSSPNLGADRVVDIYAAPLPEPEDAVVVMLQERTMAEKMDRQLTSRGAARSVTSLAAMLGHEIKNPLSGIRGAAQLIEPSLSDEDRGLARLITEETDRIAKLVDRMEVFTDERPVEREPVNIHTVLDRVKRSIASASGNGLAIVELYDPSLPSVHGNFDQLVQVFLNLVKNAAEAVADVPHGQITLTTAFRTGVRIRVPGSREKVSLPLEFCVRDNGRGVPEEIRAHLFEPFVTTKLNGTGLGLALVAKIIGDHGGVVECESSEAGATFRVLLPAADGREARTH